MTSRKASREEFPGSARPAVAAWCGGRRCAGRAARAVATLLLTALLMPAGAADVYRWVDESGQVHFGDRPPAKGAEQLTVPSSPPAAADGARLERTRRLLDAFAAERAERREERAEAAARKAARQQRCAQARRNRASFENASRVVRYDDAGNRIVLDGEAYDAAHRRVVENVEQWCDRS